MKLDFVHLNKAYTQGLNGLPAGYPVPSEEDNVLFYIQRNQNINTVIYQLNLTSEGCINHDRPLNVYWKEYESNGNIKDINLLQAKLAYGYQHSTINNNTIEIGVVSYPSYKIILTEIDGKYKALSKFGGEWQTLTNIYVYADEFGAFPNVRYVELYGMEEATGLPCFERLSISE